MGQIVYLMCSLTSTGCAILLIKAYFAKRSRLLLWSGLSFIFLALANVVLVIDVVIFPEVEFSGILIRNILGATAGCLMLFGLIWEVI